MDVQLFLARMRLQEAWAHEVEAFICWLQDQPNAGPEARKLETPVPEAFNYDVLDPALQEAGLVLPPSRDALLHLARHEMHRIVSGEIDPEEGAGNIENLSDSGFVPKDEVFDIPQIWNFCVYRRYLRGASDVGDDAWYARVVADIRAEAEFHLGLHATPPD